MNRSITAFLIAILVASFAVSAVAQDETAKKRERALAAFNEAIALREKRNFASYVEALSKFEESAKLYLEIGDDESAGRSRLGVGLMNDLTGEREKALAIYLDVLGLFRKTQNASLQARTLNNLGLLYSRLGDGQKAVRSHFDALDLRRQVGDIDGEAQTLNSLGSAYSELGERKLALDAFTKALEIRQRTGDKRAEAIVLNNLGLLRNDLGDTRLAIDLFKRSIALRRAVGDRFGEATTLNNLGLAMVDDEPEAAIANFEAALKIFGELGFENPKATILNNIGNAHLSLKDGPKALEFFRPALAGYEKANDRNGTATALNNIGFVSLGSKTPDLDSLNRALALSRETQDRGLEAIILSNLMRAYQSISQPQVAIFFGKQCVNKYQELRSSIRELDRATQRTYLTSIADQYRFLADILIADGRFDDAEKVLRMLKEEEFFGFVRRDADEIRALSQRANLTVKEKTLLERYSRLAERVTEIGERFQTLDDKRRSLLAQEGKLSDEEEAEHRRLSDELTDAAAAFRLFLEKELVAEIGRENVKKIQSDRELQGRLRRFGSGTVALSTVVSDDRYRVVLTAPTAQVSGKTEIRAADLNKKVFEFRKLLQNPKSDPKPLAKELYDIVIKPVETALKDSKAQTLVWSLDGSLRYLPLAALSPDGKSYLVEKFRNVVVTPQTRDDIGDPNVELKALGMGVSTEQTVIYPDYPDEPVKLESLPAVEDELKTLIREPDSPAETGILNGRRYLNDAFTLKNLTDSLARVRADGTKEFTVVHLASHFRLAADWSSSFLLLGNGKILTLEELGNSPLLDFSNVELITLSACNTAFAEESNGSEVDSFASLIQMRNGKAVLATLWEVEDKSAAKLMSGFYDHLRKNPKATKAEAMQVTQKQLISADGGRFAHPMFWAPFVLIGNWR